jgi:hypothetical protein
MDDWSCRRGVPFVSGGEFLFMISEKLVLSIHDPPVKTQATEILPQKNSAAQFYLLSSCLPKKLREKESTETETETEEEGDTVCVCVMKWRTSENW